MVQVLIIGLISAGIYAMFAVGIVLVYRGTKVLTFAGGEVGTAALYVAAFLVTDQGAPWFVGAITAVLTAALLGAAFEFLLVRRSVDADPVVTAILTVGLAVTLLAVELRVFGGSPKELAPPVRGGFELDNVVVSPTQIAAIVTAALLGFGLQAVLRRTDFGLGILAAADDPAAVRLVGVPLSRIRLVLWSGSFGLAALAALLVEPTVGIITPGYASTLYLGGLTAAVIGGLTSLPGAVLGSVVLGLSQAAAQRYLSDTGLAGLDYVVALVLLLVTLLGRAYLPDLRRRLDQPVRPAEVRA
jgi:branched-chain amino acid transport system permease protein